MSYFNNSACLKNDKYYVAIYYAQLLEDWPFMQVLFWKISGFSLL